MASELTSEQRQEILSDIKQGKKIQAIKKYCDFTGSRLKDSKDFIDELMAQLHEQDPEAYPQSKAGCGAGAVLLVVVGLGLVASAFC